MIRRQPVSTSADTLLPATTLVQSEGRRGATAQGGLMALTTYRKKRDFKATPEPRGKKAQSKGGDSYLIQKHAARRLHYDLRLEMDGVLKSLAVTKGPSLVPGEQRIAVRVEDHPLESGAFGDRKAARSARRDSVWVLL